MRAISFIAVLTIFCVCSNIDAARRRRVTPKPKVDPVPIPVKPPPPTAVPKKVDDLVAPVKEGVQKAIEKIVPSKAIPAPVEEPEVPQTVMCDDVMIYTPDGIRLEFDLVRLAEIDVLLGMQKNALAKGETVDGVVSSGFVFLGKFLKDHETILPHLPSDLYKLTYKIFKHAEIRADEFEEFPEKFMPLMKWMYESFPYKEGFWGGNKDELEILAKKFSERANKEFVPAGSRPVYQGPAKNHKSAEIISQEGGERVVDIITQKVSGKSNDVKILRLVQGLISQEVGDDWIEQLMFREGTKRLLRYLVRAAKATDLTKIDDQLYRQLENMIQKSYERIDFTWDTPENWTVFFELVEWVYKSFPYTSDNRDQYYNWYKKTAKKLEKDEPGPSSKRRRYVGPFANDPRKNTGVTWTKFANELEDSLAKVEVIDVPEYSDEKEDEFRIDCKTATKPFSEARAMWRDNNKKYDAILLYRKTLVDAYKKLHAYHEILHASEWNNFVFPLHSIFIVEATTEPLKSSRWGNGIQSKQSYDDALAFVQLVRSRGFFPTYMNPIIDGNIKEIESDKRDYANEN